MRGQRRLGAHRTGQSVRRVQHELAAAPVHGEGVAGRRFAGRGREVPGEVEDVAGRRAPPAVDRLAGVAHRGDRVATSRCRVRTGEEPAQQGRLRGRGVLVLVEQHHRELPPQRFRHRRHLRGEAGRGGHLVGELHVAQLGLQLLVPDHQGREFEALGECRLGGLDRRVGLSPRVAGSVLQRGGETAGMVGEPDRVDQVGAQFPGQLQQPLGDRGRPQPGQLGEPRGVGHDAGRQPVAGGPGDHPGISLDAEHQPVLCHQPAGEGVVGEDQFLPRLDVPGEHARLTQGDPHPAGELTGGLARERESQHLLGPHLARPDQPHHPGGHHGGLAGAGAGDHDGRRQGRGDRRQLLVGERDAERRAEL